MGSADPRNECHPKTAQLKDGIPTAAVMQDNYDVSYWERIFSTVTHAICSDWVQDGRTRI
jgi:hypothetical protein